MPQSAGKPVGTRRLRRLFAGREVRTLSHVAMQQKSSIAVKRSGFDAEAHIGRKDHRDCALGRIFRRLFGMNTAPRGNPGAIALD